MPLSLPRCYNTRVDSKNVNRLIATRATDTFFFFFFFFYIPAPFLGHASRNAVATGGEKGKDNVQELCE